VVTNGHYGQGARANCPELCCVGVSIVKQQSGITCSGDKRTPSIKGLQGNQFYASAVISMVFLAYFDIRVTAYHIPGLFNTAAD